MGSLSLEGLREAVVCSYTGVSLACDQFGVKVLSQGSLDYMCRVEWNSRTMLEIRTDQWVPVTVGRGGGLGRCFPF